MPGLLHDRLLAEARAIGDRLVAAAETTPRGLFWTTAHLDELPEGLVMRWSPHLSLYNGVTGIALFLVELYGVTGDPRYLDCALGACRWAEEAPEEEAAAVGIRFHSGVLGIGHVLIRLAQVTGEKSHLMRARALVDRGMRWIDQVWSSDLMGGDAGIALALTHLLAETGDLSLRPLIDGVLDRLFRSAEHGPAGVFWGRNRDQAGGLCGFAHGASGIAFALLEVGRFFSDERLIWMARQAFDYEDHFFDPRTGNWPDLRRVPAILAAARENPRQAQAEVTTRTAMVAWCHGAPGIGLARLRAWELTGDPVQKERAEAAIERTRQDVEKLNWDRDRLVLCHGVCGNSDLFLEGARVLGDERLLDLAAATAERLLDWREAGGTYKNGYPAGGEVEDLSLFMGSAGIGLFLLRVLRPSEVPSVLSPKLPPGQAPAGSNSRRSWLMTVEGPFGRTLRFLDSHGLPPESLARHDDAPENILALLRERILGATEALGPEPGQQARDVLALEWTRMEVSRGAIDAAALFVGEQLAHADFEQVSAQPAAELLRRTVHRLAGAEIVTTEWNWSGRESPPSERGSFHVVLIPSSRGVQELVVSDFAATVLEAISQPRTPRRVGAVVDEVAALFGEITEAEREKVSRLVLEQIKAALAAGFLRLSPDA